MLFLNDDEILLTIKLTRYKQYIKIIYRYIFIQIYIFLHIHIYIYCIINYNSEIYL